MSIVDNGWSVDRPLAIRQPAGRVTSGDGAERIIFLAQVFLVVIERMESSGSRNKDPIIFPNVG